MAMELVTGHAGEAHVTAAQAARLNMGIAGDGLLILQTGQQFAITLDSANQVTIGTGDALFDGRHVTNEAPQSLAVESGTQGMHRYDLVLIRYERDTSTGVESASLVVRKGTPVPVGSEAEDPAYPASPIYEGPSATEWPIYRLHVNGIVVEAQPLALDNDYNNRAIKPLSMMGWCRTATASVAIPGGNISTRATGPSIGVDAGTYLVVAKWQFANANATKRNADVTIYAGSTEIATQRIHAASGAFMVLSVVGVVSVEDGTDIVAKASSDVKSDAASARLWVVCLG